MTNECGQEAEQISGYGDKLVEQQSLVCEKENLIFNTFVDFSQWRDLRIGVMRKIESFNNCTSKRVLGVLKPR